MGAELIATAIPKRTEQQYEASIAAADDHALAIAAFHACYQGEFGIDETSGITVADLIGEADPAAIELILDRPAALDAIRAAARDGARYLSAQVTITGMTYGGSYVFDAALLGGPDLLVVGGSAFGDDPFTQFREVALLAALLAADGPQTGQVTTKEA